jgi:DNA-binding CsgD family transcriptional regulator
MGGVTAPDFGPTRLLERDRELEMLDHAIAATLAGGAGLVLVEGPAGIGKSRLVAEARRRAAESALLVLSARGGELERDFPFGVVRQLFEPRLADEGVRERVLSGSAGAAAAIFGLSGEPVGDEASREWTFAALHGLYWLTVNLSAEAPLLLAVDDLHWCDRASLRFLAYLTRRLEGLPILAVGTLRPSEPGADEALLAELTSDPDARVLVPGPLSAGAAAEVVRERLGDGVKPAFAAACHASTHGNPLLLSELLKALQAERVPPDAAHLGVVAELGPRAASRAVLLRLARLSADAVSVARSVAVLGDGAELAVVGALAGLDDEAIPVAGRELVRAEILRPEPPLGFVHPLVQASVYRDLAPGERELSHERAARLLLARDAPAEQVAAHVLAMPRHGEDWVVEVLRAAAHAALTKGAPDAAISSLRRALDEPLRPELRTELLFELGRAQALTSLPGAAEALRGAYGSREPAIRGHAADWLACTLNFMEAPDEAAEIARRTTLELPSELDDLGRQLEAGELVSLFFGARDDDGERLARLRSHRAIDAERGAGAKMLAAVAAWEWAESAGPADQVVALARAALRDETLVAADAGFLAVAAILPLALADLDEAAELWEAVRAEAHRSGFVFTVLAVQLWGGYTQYLRGELAEAETELRAALATAVLWGVPAQQPWATAVLAELLLDRRAVAEARAILDAAIRPRRPGSDPAILLDRARVRVLLAEGRAEEALAQADVLQRHAGWRCHPRYVPWRSLKAQALDRLGRREEAVTLAAEEVEIARAWGSPGTVGRSLRVLGTIDREHGLDHLEEACAVLEHAPARLERAKALAALGEALRRARRPTDAREPLRKALELAEISGATALVERTRAEIYATGARPRTTALRGVGALTASERRVAGLAVDGLSNRDIAQTLYVTPKTVEVHLGNAYRKLGIASRRELPDTLASAAA